MSAGALFCGHIVGVEDGAAVERLATAADAAGKAIAYAFEGGDLIVETRSPRFGKLLPFLLRWGPVGGQGIHAFLDLDQREPNLLRGANERDSPQHIAGVPPLAAERAI